MAKKQFTKLRKSSGAGGYSLYLSKKAMQHLRINPGSEICLTYNKNKTITISKASYSSKLIEEITLQLDLANFKLE